MKRIPSEPGNLTASALCSSTGGLFPVVEHRKVLSTAACTDDDGDSCFSRTIKFDRFRRFVAPIVATRGAQSDKGVEVALVVLVVEWTGNYPGGAGSGKPRRALVAVLCVLRAQTKTSGHAHAAAVTT